MTGASSGIGAATVKALVSAGYRVALLTRRAERISPLASELGEASVLVNNAGVMPLGPSTASSPPTTGK